MEVEIHYNNLAERIAIDNEQTAKGFRMIHDDFDEDSTTSGTMIYTDAPEVITPTLSSRNLEAEFDELKVKVAELEKKMMTTK